MRCAEMCCSDGTQGYDCFFPASAVSVRARSRALDLDRRIVQLQRPRTCTSAFPWVPHPTHVQPRQRVVSSHLLPSGPETTRSTHSFLPLLPGPLGGETVGLSPHVQRSVPVPVVRVILRRFFVERQEETGRICKGLAGRQEGLARLPSTPHSVLRTPVGNALAVRSRAAERARH